MKKSLLFFMSLLSLIGFSQIAEDFENPTYPPTGWITFDNGIGVVQSWQRTTMAGFPYNGSVGAAMVRGENVTDGTFAEDWMVTSQVLVPTDGQLRFFTRKAIGANFGTQYDIRISTASQNTPGDFTTIQSWNDATINANQSSPVYEQKVIDLTAYAGQNVYLAFVMTNDAGNWWLVDDVYVDQRCLDITNLSVSSINDTSVDLNWDNPSGATEWEIEWGPTGFAQGTGTIITNVTTNPYTLTGLTAATQYDFYVRPVCANNNFGNWAGPESFTTAVCAITDQCDFDFVMTDSFGDGWNGASMQITQFGVPVATIGSTFTGGSGPVTITVALCSNDPFEVVWTSGGGFPNEVGLEIIDPNGVSVFTLPFNSGSQAGTTIYAGVAACTPPTCPQPSNVIVSGVNTSSGTITWSDNTSGVAVPATEWQVIIQPAGSGYPPSGAEIINTTVFTTSYSFSGLNSDTDYEVWISAVCDAGGVPDPSFWEGPTNFSTTPDFCSGDSFNDPGGPTANYANNANQTITICPDNPGDVVMVIFNTFALENNFDFLSIYDGDNAAAPLLGTFTGNNLPPQFISSAPSGCLTFVFTSDGSVTAAGWDATIVCTVPPACSQPTGLSVTSITPDSATLSWTDTNTPPSTNWQVVVQPVGTGYPNGSSTIIPATTNPFTVTGLNPNSSYEFYVLSDCGAVDGLSFWTGPVTFNTLFPGCGGSDPASDICIDATPLCSLDGYCGNTSGTYSDASWGALDTAFCGSIENNSFLTFQATATSISMDVEVGNCTNGSGIQFFVFQATCGGPITSLDCYFQMDPGTNSLTFNGLVPGQQYVLMVDGFAGAICDYSVSVTSGGGSVATDVQISQDNQTICLNETLTLDVTGGNGIYNWDPATGLSATTGNSVVFTPPAPGVYTINVESTDTNSLCATADFIEVTVLDVITPSFTNPGPLCQGSPNVILETTDANGFSGTWTLAGTPVTEVDASAAGLYDYLFTPDPVLFPCSPTFTMQVEIRAACTFGIYATAVYMDNCETTNPGEFFNISGSGTDLIGPSANIFTNNDYGTYLQNSGNLIFKGAELKSFKTASSNVCQANMYYRVYEASSVPGAFNVIALPLFDDCTAGTFPSGGPCNVGDQKWQDVSQSIDLTQNAPGDYIIEVYYELIGDNDSPVDCDGDIEILNNSGNNYIATYTIQGAISFTQSNEECASSNGFITVSGFVPGDVYSVTYDDDTVTVGPVDYQADFNGDIIISGLDAGTYENFNFVINGCSIFDATPILITNFSPSVTNVSNNSPICFGNDAIFIVEGTPNFNIDYSINGGAVQTTTIDASGNATITIASPAAGNVDLALLNIYNTVCNITLTNTSSVLVNPLPTATISATNTFECVGNDASFSITGTPNAEVTYSINGGANTTATLDALGNYTLIVPSTVNVEVTLISVVNPGTGCTDTLTGVANVAIITVPEATADVTQPTCAVPLGTVEVTSPLISQVNFPGDLFISEITDAQPGSLTYVEIYNGTGADVDLSNYKIRVTTNGTTLSCDLPLSGTLVNDDVVVIKLSSSADEGGVVADLTFTTCTGVNNNDRIALTNLANVDIDVWGTPDGSPFTPASGIGYNYQRITTGTILPSTTWDPADWNATDWGNPTATTGDYSNVGIYTLYASNYEYILAGSTTTTQTTTTFVDVAPGTYTLTVHDTATGCFSNPITITIDPVVFVDPVTTFSYTTPVCEGDVNILPDTSSVGFATGGVYSAVPSGLVIDAATGEVDLTSSLPGIYTITYSIAADVANCINASSSTFNLTINSKEIVTFDMVEVCLGAFVDFPTISTEGYSLTGSWSPSAIVTSSVSTTDYIFTPDDPCYDQAIFTVDVVSCAIQKGISPNDDGLNDYFDLSAYNVKRLEIFNRYGKKVYSKTNYTNEWEGQASNGNELLTGTYYYVIEFEDLPSKTGWIYINREE